MSESHKMDIQMPVMNGIQATKEIRRIEKLNAAAGYPPMTPPSNDTSPALDTPTESPSSTRSFSSPYGSSVIIVALTASSLQSDRVAALAAGCNDFLTKPVSLLWLNNKIIEWGSIKALQMWADLRPEMVKNISTEREIQTRHVAQRLHVPESRTSPSPSRSPSVPMTAMPMQKLPEPNSILFSSISADKQPSSSLATARDDSEPACSCSASSTKGGPSQLFPGQYANLLSPREYRVLNAG
jgi:osomolarity two-component system response regulator SSK1